MASFIGGVYTSGDTSGGVYYNPVVGGDTYINDAGYETAVGDWEELPQEGFAVGESFQPSPPPPPPPPPPIPFTVDPEQPLYDPAAYEEEGLFGFPSHSSDMKYDEPESMATGNIFSSPLLLGFIAIALIS